MSDITIHPFDQALQLLGGPNRFYGHPSPAYANTRGPFGGITAAMLLSVLLEHPDRLGDPVSQTVNYVAPIADEAFEIDVQLLRTNRSTQHWFVTLMQEGGVAASSTAVFAKRRETWGDTELSLPTIPPVEACQRVDTAFLPTWAKNYAMWFEDSVPFFGSGARQSSETVQWLREKPPRALNFASLASMCDLFFPRIFIRSAQFAPVGTVSLTTYFHTQATQLAAHGEQLLIGRARANRFNDSYYDQSAEIWSSSGELFATSNQIVYFKL